MDLYTLLGCTKESTLDEIRAAYKKLAMTRHPDKGGSEDEFKELKFAYEVLSDNEKRAIYDATGSIDSVNKPPYDPHQDIYNILQNVIRQNLYRLTTADIIAECRTQLNYILQDLGNKVVNLTTSKDKLVECHTRLTRKSGTNVLGMMLQQEIDGLSREITGLEDNEIKIAQALDLLEEYVYAFTEEPTATGSVFWDSSATFNISGRTTNVFGF